MRCHLAAVALAFSAALAWSQSGDERMKELEGFQGSWTAVSVQGLDGRPVPTEEVADTRLFVKGNKFTLSGKGYSISGAFTIDPNKSPKTIDIVMDEDKASETKLLGIYDVKDGIRKSCFAATGRERPTGFMYGKENYLIFEWKAQK